MGIRDWFSRRRQVKAIGEAKQNAMALLRSGAPPRRGTRELLQAYRTMPWLHAVTNRLANECASAVKLRLLTAPDGDPDSQPVDSKDPRAEMLAMLRRPTWGISARQRWKLCHLWLSLVGEAYLVKQRGPTGLVTGLVPLSPLWVDDLPKAARPTYLIKLTGDTAPVEIDPRDVIPLRDVDPYNPWSRGVGMAECLADELDSDEYSAQSIKAFFANGGVPDILITAKGANEDALAQAEAKFRQRYNGPRKAHQVHWSGAELSVQRIDTSFRDQDLVALREFEKKTIIQTFSVSPEIFGILEGSTRNSIESAYYLLALGVQVPWLDLLTDALQADLVPEFGGEFFVSYKSPIPEDRDLKLRAISVAPSAFRVADLRALAGFLPDQEIESLRLGEQAIRSGPTNVPPGKAAD